MIKNESSLIKRKKPPGAMPEDFLVDSAYCYPLAILPVYDEGL
jgi:hypothetical protein